MQKQELKQYKENNNQTAIEQKDSFTLYADCLAKQLLLQGTITVKQYEQLVKLNKTLNHHTS